MATINNDRFTSTLAVGFAHIAVTLIRGRRGERVHPGVPSHDVWRHFVRVGWAGKFRLKQSAGVA